MKYPYIANNNLMFYAKGTATVVGDKDNLNTHGFKVTADECDYKNITREYLEGKCVKIESPEHSEFVQRLAFNAGFKWGANAVKLIDIKAGETLNFHGDGTITYDPLGHDGGYGYDLITIPLPPKAEPELVKPDTWPKIGDTVTWGSKVITGEVKGISENVAWIKNEYGNYVTEYLTALSKPKTEAEILRDEIYDDIESIKHISSDSGVEMMLRKYNITKKPQ